MDGNWGAWTPTTVCSVSCGIGFIDKQRVCNQPLPSGTGLDCLKGVQTRGLTETGRDSCNPGTCPCKYLFFCYITQYNIQDIDNHIVISQNMR